MSHYDIDETEDVDMMSLMVGDSQATIAGLARASGTVYLSGDIHPLGAFSALMKAAQQHVPYASTSAINALFPIEWLRSECLHDIDRMRIIGNLEKIVRESKCG